MNCKQIEELLPLYVSSDLEESRARLVTAHLQLCQTCSGVVAEYRETRRWLHTFVPPSFTEDVYAEMRAGVWRKIEAESTRPSRFIISNLFHPRLAWAVAAALLIAVSVLATYLIGRRGTLHHQVVSNQPSTHQTAQDKQPLSSPQDAIPPASALVTKRGGPRTATIHQPESRPKRNSISDSANLAAVTTSEAASSTAVPEPSLSSPTQSSYGVSDDALAPLRMEIQTKNPNIRIIWFARRDAKPASPNSRGI